jgi:hypothetical protein
MISYNGKDMNVCPLQKKTWAGWDIYFSALKVSLF